MTPPPDARHPIPWDRIFRDLARRYGWTDAEIWELTLADIRLYLAGDDDERREPGHREGIGLAAAFEKINASRKARGLEPITEIRTLK